MPRLSDSMAEGVVGKWLRGLNDAVSAGDELLEIETDKVTMTLQVDVRGFVVEVLAEEGAVVPVGAVVAVIGSVPAAPSTAPLTAPAAPARAEAPAAPTEASTNRSAKTAAHEPGERERFVERLRDIHGFLAQRAVRDEQHFIGLHAGMKFLHLFD